LEHKRTFQRDPFDFYAIAVWQEADLQAMEMTISAFRFQKTCAPVSDGGWGWEPSTYGKHESPTCLIETSHTLNRVMRIVVSPDINAEIGLSL
jgi:hypothetical protein